jgi:hypothetical protein
VIVALLSNFALLSLLTVLNRSDFICWKTIGVLEMHYIGFEESNSQAGFRVSSLFTVLPLLLRATLLTTFSG